jgi:hypothetical protein
LDAEIEVAKQYLSDIESKRTKDLQRTRNQVEEVAQGAAESVDAVDGEDIPPEVLFQFEEERQKAAQVPSAKAEPIPAPRVSLATQVEVKPSAPVAPAPPVSNAPISTIVENGVEIPVYSLGDQVLTEDPAPEIKPLPSPRHSINPRFRHVPGKLGSR